MANPKELSPQMQERYGVRRSRVAPILVGVLIAGLVAGGTGYANFRQQNPTISSQLLAFNVLSDNQVAVTWEVNRGANTTTYCVLRAQDERRTDVGYATITVAAGDPYQQIKYPLATGTKAALAELLGCSASPNMRVPAANFPPGVKIPQQPAPGVAPSAN
jgi:hypothetical protein